MRRFYESLEQMLSNVSELKYGLARRLDRGVADLFPDAAPALSPRAGRDVRRDPRWWRWSSTASDVPRN